MDDKDLELLELVSLIILLLWSKGVLEAIDNSTNICLCYNLFKQLVLLKSIKSLDNIDCEWIL